MLTYTYAEETAADARKALQQKKTALEKRAAMMAALREFFAEEGFLEVFTPTRIPAPALEDYIDAIPSGKAWLRTSPELHMKRMLAAGYPKIYQTGPCFRLDEFGRRHLTEFTMLEWYRANADWHDLMRDIMALARRAAMRANGTLMCPFLGRDINLELPWQEVTVTDAFRQYAGIDLKDVIASGRFEEILVEKVEPHLGNETPTFLTEYPIECSGLSRQIPGKPHLVERWELYCAGIEIGNACSELTDPAEQLRRFDATAQLRADDNRDVYALDTPFMDAINLGMPPCAGVAIGLDRLAMLLADADTIADVNAFVER